MFLHPPVYMRRLCKCTESTRGSSGVVVQTSGLMCMFCRRPPVSVLATCLPEERRPVVHSLPAAMAALQDK